MIPYLGEYRYSVDEKGRFNVPAKFREIMRQEPSTDLVLIKGLDGCVFLLPLSTWRRFRAPMDEDHFLTESDARLFSRRVLRGGDVQQPDAQGRIQLNRDLREHARIADQIVIYGNDDRIEVWSPEVFDTYMDAGGATGGTLEEGAHRHLRRRASGRAANSNGSETTAG